MEEAYRTIKVSEGNRQISIPIAKAVIRALAANAARGQLRSQQAFTKLLSETERTQKNLMNRLFDASLDYKLKWDEELERRKKLGITGPAPLPHPDDVHLNFRTSEVTFVGPLTKEGKVQWDRLHDLLEKADRELETMTAQLKKTRSRTDRSSLEHEIFELGRARELLVERIGEPSQRRKMTAPISMEASDHSSLRRAVRARATRSRTPATEKMRDLLVLDSNIVQIEDVGGSNPLCSTWKSPRTARGSRRPQCLDYLVR
jgi:hypothetical protein